MGEIDSKRPLRPPYAPVKGVREFFERVATRARPELIDTHFLQVLGISAGNEQHVVSALKFVGLVDSKGLPSADFDVLYLRGPDRRTGLQRLLLVSYERIFASGVDLRTASRVVVHDLFVKEYGMRGQMARKATALFALLCLLSGVVVSDQLARDERPRSTTASLEGASARARPSRPAAKVAQTAPIPWLQKWPIVVALSSEMKEDEMVAFLLRVKRAIAKVEAGGQDGPD